MKALVASEYTPLDRISVTEHPTPTPEAGQVLIRVEAAALNPLDLMLITGAAKESYPAAHPLVVGMDAAGTVAEVGEGVSGYAPGDPVLAFQVVDNRTITIITPPQVAGTYPLVVTTPAGSSPQFDVTYAA